MMTENIELENALKTWMGQVMRLSMRSFIEYTTETGLSMPQIAVLFLLNSDKHRAVTELGEEFGVSSAAASQMVEKLVQTGFVERVEDSNDRRIRRLLLTTKGKNIVERNIEARQRWMRSFCSTFSPESARDTARVFRDITEAAKRFEVAQAPVPRHNSDI